ncbi:pyridoxamine 5'-phosphate oxidase [Haloflavibacter putidus]|uniref:Pyridoxine/pyridoxamine 5'-phosphate oxidase n=1 Tax=Haloflavibacter putidus TaxID=2576776 RepID=A0A507ZR38_9FLAO|nr:pyridoxamine 5'-phosphate oxidase [Haloflavibacter putidus]TQD40060.1 pyridoxamine 5'-phosphate oxidase [Haloflavibacter putidus]
MEKNLENYRKSYQKYALEREDLAAQPIDLFKKWFDEVEENGSVEEANAMHLSTFGKDGFPKNRVVLLKKVKAEGFVFYTNYNSEKAKAIAHNNKVCLSFFWPGLERQVIIKGTASKVSEEESDAYFNSRPKGSQLGALASPQSDPIENREVLEENLKSLEEKYADEAIKRPASWGGYLVKPDSVEFWQGRPNRLHDRFLYRQNQNGEWTATRLAP